MSHQPRYDNPHLLDEAVRRLREYPPLVFPGEVRQLRSQIHQAALGRSFILQGGDCVERFVDCNPTAIGNKLKILLQMSVVLAYGLRKPVVRIGRFAGQYFKPRTNETEVVDGVEVPTYKGDTVHRFEATSEARRSDPMRLIDGYFHATATLNYIRSMIDGGFADLHYPYRWNLHTIEASEQWREYRDVVEQILDAIHFMESFGGTDSESLGRVDFFTSHEGLHLPYESSMTRFDGQSGETYNLGAHTIWIGKRTSGLDGAHIEYFRGISNPIGIKVSVDMRPEVLVRLCEILDPQRAPGRLTLITRLGAKQAESHLPSLIAAVRESRRTVAWSCDPMHGNTVSTDSGVKTRRFEDILAEIGATHRVHGANGSHLAGVHFELTGEEVTECTGGAGRIGSGDLGRNYQTYCDPRLNYAQSMEMAFLLAKLLKAK